MKTENTYHSQNSLPQTPNSNADILDTEPDLTWR